MPFIFAFEVRNVCCTREQERNSAVGYCLIPPSTEGTGGPLFYGAAACCHGQEVMRVEDITTDRKALEQLLRRCTQAGLSLCHFREVIEDFVAEPQWVVAGEETARPQE